MSDFKIAASILSADFARLGEDSSAVIKAGADWIHFDVMDNHYVPNLTFGPMVCKALRDYGIKVPIDVHLMVKPVDEMIKDFAKSGATSITIHPESTEHLDRSLSLIHEHNCRAGLAFNPGTPLTYLEHVIDKVDMILIMSVNPGFGGQKFIEASLDKIRKVRTIIRNTGRNIRLQVDGGINKDNIDIIAKAGADTFVAGSAIFHSEDYATTIGHFHNALLKTSH